MQDQYEGEYNLPERNSGYSWCPLVLTATARQVFNDVRDIADPTNDTDPMDWEDVPGAPEDDVDAAMNGRDGFMASGAGGELRDTVEDAIRGERETQNKK
jgi:hypothetical protein